MAWQPEYPKGIVIPAHNSNTLGPPTYRPAVVVLHTPEEEADTYFATPQWFAQYHPGQEGSTNAALSALGFLIECVAPGVAPIANGVTPDKRYPGGADENINLNRQSRSIEIEGRAATIGRTMPRGGAQWNALIDWIAFQCELHGIPPDRKHIIGHYEVAGNRSDPGTLDINAVVQDVQKLISQEEEPVKIYKVVSDNPASQAQYVWTAEGGFRKLAYPDLLLLDGALAPDVQVIKIADKEFAKLG